MSSIYPESQGKPSQPLLEMVYRQTAACLLELGLRGNGAAVFADMNKEFLEA
jgi:Ran-binding protein 9/10